MSCKSYSERKQTIVWKDAAELLGNESFIPGSDIFPCVLLIAMCKTFLAAFPPNTEIMRRCHAQLATQEDALRKTMSPFLPPIKSLMPPCARNEEHLDLVIECSLDIYNDRANSTLAKKLVIVTVVIFTAQCPSHLSFYPSTYHSDLPSLFVPGTCSLFEWMDEWWSQVCCVYSLCILCSLQQRSCPPCPPVHTQTLHTLWYLSKYLEIFLAGIQVGCPAIVITMKPALLRSPPPIRVGRWGTDLFISNPARLHSQGDIALKVWGMEIVKGRVRYFNLKTLLASRDKSS